ncbi:MAG: ABC transporter ATP-binding protein [Hyphomicrobiales bacterium]|nr:ABC transporter ATP-binding protein [Hyphomicrobiales bacterium]
MSEKPLVALRGIEKRFASGVRALGGLDLDVRQGEFLSLLGPSGCGKSTALRLIAGLSEPNSGAVEWRDGARPEIGFVFQEPTLMPWTSVAKNVFLPLRLQGVAWRDAASRVREALAGVGLAGFADAYPRELSGGMRMRVSIARALVTKPPLLLMDEPFAALDEITRFRLNDDLLALAAQLKTTVIFVTHSVFESVYLSSRIAVFAARPGRVTETIEISAPRVRHSDFRLAPEFSDYARRASAALDAASGARAA